MAYDEDLTQNRFFVALQRECPQLYETASANRFMIFVPRAASLGADCFTETQYLNHVIQLIDLEQTQYKTLSDKEVKIVGNNVTTGTGFADHKQVQILFEETFFNRNDESFRVLCINQPLEGTTPVSCGDSLDEQEGYSSQIRNLDDCVTLLWANQGKTDKTRRHLDNLIDLFNKTCQRLEKESLRHQVDAASALFTRSIQLVLKNSHIKKKTKGDETFMDSVKLAVETYVVHGVYSALFNNLSGCVSNKDATLNKITRNLKHLQLKHLHIKLEFMQNVPRARKELLNLNPHTTPLGKLSCIKRVVKALSQVQKRHSGADLVDSPALTTDDLLPILVYLVVKADVPNWWANLTFIKHCRFSRTSSDDEFGFYIATLEAALEHVTTGELSKMDLDSTNPQRLQISPTSSQQFQVPGSGTGSSASASLWSRQDSSESDVNKLFQFIRDSNSTAVATMLNAPTEKSPSGDIGTKAKSLGLCHPLCACDKCRGSLNRDKQNQSSAVTVFSRDEQGATVLHVAAALNDTLILESLIQRGAVVNATDYNGQTALHVACEKGRQGSAFMLLHYKADVNIQDNDGNSALHLATSHGHEDCVKALIYYDQGVSTLNISAPNDLGDTALHLAARWGFETLVALLIENGADVTALNRRRQTPAMMALNFRVTRLLNDAAVRYKKLMKKSSSAPNLYRLNSSQTASCPNLSVSAHAASPGKPPPSLPASPATHTGPMSPTSPTAGYTAIHRSPMSPGFSHATGGMDAILEDQLDSGAGSAVTSPRHGKQRDLTDLERNVEKLLKHVADGDIEMVKYELGWSEEDEELDSPDPGPSSLCHPLCQCKKCHPLQKLTSAAPSGVHVNATNQQGFSPLHVASLQGHVALVELFMLRGGDPGLRTNTHQCTPLHLACQNNRQFTHKVVRCLIDYGCKVNARDSTGNTALHYCCLNGNNASAVLLLERGCLVNQANSRGNTALHEAARWNNVGLVESLLRFKASVSARNQQNLTPMQLAQGEKVLRLLCEVSIQQSSMAAAASEDGTEKQESPAAVAPPPDEHRVSVRDIFAALQEPEIDRLQQIASSVQNFHTDDGASLRRTPETRDRSAPRLDHHLAHVLAIHNHNPDQLQHVQTRVSTHVVVSDNTPSPESPVQRNCSYEEGVDIFEEARAEMAAESRQHHTSSVGQTEPTPGEPGVSPVPRSNIERSSTKLTEVPAADLEEVTLSACDPQKTDSSELNDEPPSDATTEPGRCIPEKPVNLQVYSVQQIDTPCDKIPGVTSGELPQETMLTQGKQLRYQASALPSNRQRKKEQHKTTPLLPETVTSECESEDSTTESQRDELEVE